MRISDYILSKKSYLFQVALLILVTGGYTFHTADYESLNLDDPIFRESFSAESGKDFKHTLTHVGELNLWHPITWWSFIFVDHLFDDLARGNRLLNILIHIANVCLLALLVTRTSQRFWLGLICGAILAFHPVSVQSFAWISERKGLLADLGLLLFLFFGTWGITKRDKSGILFALLGLLLACGSKPTSIIAPLALVLSLLLNRFPWRDIGKSREAMILLSLSTLICAGLGFLTLFLHFQGGHHSPRPVTDLSPLQSIVHAVFYYLGSSLSFFEHSLLVRTPQTYPSWITVLSLGVLGVIARYTYKISKPSFAIAVLALVLLLPNLIAGALTPFYVADRYSYLSTPLFLIALWVLIEPFLKRLPKPIMVGLLSLSIVFLVVRSHEVKSRYQSSVTLFTHELTHCPNSVLPAVHLASALAAQGKTEASVGILEEKLSKFPKNYLINVGLAEYHMGLQNPELAFDHLQIAVKSQLAKPRDFRSFVVLAAKTKKPNSISEGLKLGLDRFPSDQGLNDLQRDYLRSR